MNLKLGITSEPGAIFSPCEKYRYTLWRTKTDAMYVKRSQFGDWMPQRYVNFICLNPSTATDAADDPTIRRITNFALDWGYDAVCITNIFAYRSTSPRILKTVDNPTGDDNDAHIRRIASESALVVAAWSQHGQLFGRGAAVRRMMLADGIQLHYLKMSESGQPYHPLYLHGTTKPIIWTTNN